VIANLLTALRLALAAPVALAFALPGVMSSANLVAVVLLAMATDVADGRAARRFGTASSRGMLFDHVTDFIFVTSGLAGLAYAGQIGALLPILIVVAFSQYVLDSYFLSPENELSGALEWRILFLPPRSFLSSCARGIAGSAL